MATQDFLFWLAGELRRLVGPLELSLASEDAFSGLLKRYGWVVASSSIDITAVRGAIAIRGDLDAATELVKQIASPAAAAVPVTTYVDLAGTLRRVLSTIRSLSTIAAPAGLSAEVWTSLTSELPEGIIADYLELTQPALFAVLLLTGAVEEEAVDVGGAPGRTNHRRRRLRWRRLSTAISDPASLAREVYAWNDPTKPLKFELLLDRLRRFFLLLGLPAELNVPPQLLLADYYSSGNPALPNVRELRLTLICDDESSNGTFDATLRILPIPPRASNAAAPNGVMITPAIKASGTLPMALPWPFSIELAGAFQSDAGIRAEVRPEGVDVSVAPGAGAVVNATAAIGYGSRYPLLLFGTRFSHRLQFRGWTAGITVVGPLQDPDVEVALDVDMLELIVDMSEADGFLQKIFGEEPQTLEFSGSLAWSSKRGLRLSGQTALELVFPINLTIGVVEVLSVMLRLEASQGALGIIVAATGSLKLGPVVASVDRMGVKLTLKAVPSGQPAGAFGDIDLEFGFKSPDGLGLALDASVIKGGGYLSIDEAKGEYAGILELAIKDLIQVKAIGLLNTKLPGGQKGFSLLLIITAQGLGIQLGFGIKLDGVGGLIGVNRTMVVDVLRAGIKNRTVDSVMFPPDPVKNATKILSDLRSIFPPVEGRFVLGPMVELAWGTPTLLRARLGIVIELPTPIRIAILGQITAILPEEKKALVKISLDSIGIIEFEKKSLAIDATLYDSQVAGFALSGDMALRLTWGESPNFVLSVGGFNPRFSPPPNVPQLSRLTLTMGSGANPRLSLDTYVALTSNTTQFGAHLEVRAEGGGFVVHGHLGYDALFVFDPFSFVAEMSGGVDLLRGSSVLMSIHLDVTLTGPQPWHAWGRATANILFLNVSVSFDATWGEGAPVSLPRRDAKGPLLKALAEPSSWSGDLPAATELGVSLGDVKPSEKAVLVHPAARLTVRQKIVPFELTITKFGNAAPDGANYFKISKVDLNGASVAYDSVEEFFAPAQFQQMSDGDALTSSSYKRLKGGVSAGAAAVKNGPSSTVNLVYTTYLVDNPLLPLIPGERYLMKAGTYFALIQQGPGARSPVLNTGEAKYAVPGQQSAVSVSDLDFVVVSTDDMSIRTDLADANGEPELTARDKLERHLAEHTEERGNLQVVAKYEVPA